MRFMQVLFVHYYRFKGALDEEHVVKINHPIEAKASLTVGNKTYSLVGVLVHAGESAETGHYYFTTVCPPYNITRSAYRSNDAAEPEPIDMDQLRADILNAYMLVYQLNDDLPAEQSATTAPPLLPRCCRKKGQRRCVHPLQQASLPLLLPSQPAQWSAMKHSSRIC